MKILHVVPTYLPARRYGGPIVAVHGLCRALVARGHDVTVFTTNVDGDSNSEVSLDQEVILDGVRVRYFASTFRRLYVSPAMRAALGDAGAFDLVHNHSVFLWPTMAGANAARKHGVPYVISPRGMLVRDLIRRKSAFVKRAWIAMIERRNFAHASAIHFTSERERLDAREVGIPIPRSFVVPNGIDLIPRPDVARDPNTVVYLGRINWKKGLDRLIEALPSGAKLIIAGNDEERLTPRLRDLARGRDVDFAGPVYGDAKWELLARASVFVLPSLSENFGNVVVEAMMMSTPVIVSPEVGVGSDVEAASAGIVTHDFASAISEILRDPRDYGRNGRALVESKFTWPAVAEEMEREYRCSIGRPRHPERSRGTGADRDGAPLLPPDPSTTLGMTITPVILTKDEEPNIGRTLERLTWAREVIVCDSGSRDATLDIARRFPNVRIVERPLDTLANQWTFAVDQATSDWVLTLDADYIVPQTFVDEMASLDFSAAGYESSFVYAINGRPLRATLYTPRAVLLRRDRSTFYMDGHTQRVRVDGRIVPLREKIIHDDRKSMRNFIARQRRYMRDEAAKLRAADPRTLNTAAKVRKLRFVAPLVVVPYLLFAKKLVLDGRAGLRYTFERFLAELILAKELTFGRK